MISPIQGVNMSNPHHSALGGACAPTSTSNSRRRSSLSARVIGIIRSTWIIAAVVSVTASSWAAERVAHQVGQRVENFSLPDFHGQPRALADYSDRVVVLAFLGVECPLAKLYVLRLNELAAEFSSQGVVFLGIDSNLQDSLSDLGAFARTHQVAFPLLKDNNNEVADRVGAVRTPEVFVLDRERVVRYRGRIDDQYGFKTGAGFAKPKLGERSLADALDEVLRGKTVTNPVREAQGCLIGRVTKVAPHGEVTYAKQIARILQQRCVECHRAGQLAPFSLTTYDEVVGWASMILEVVEEGRMPPWFADARFGHFSNDSRLSEAERRQLATWVENGCPRGDDRDLPEAAQYAEGWQMGEPDQIIYMRDEPFDVPAEGIVNYQYFTVDPGWDTEKWIVATEARPGNRAVVHHNVVWVRAGPATEIEPTQAIAWYGPGFSPFVCAPGTAIYVPAHAKLEFSMHYTANGTAQPDRSMVGIRFADPSEVKALVRIPYSTERDFKIPPGDPNYEVRSERTVWKDLLVYSLLPHMHLRGKSFHCEAEYAEGRREVLLDIPRYDPNWQLRYIFSEPKLVPAGTKLFFTAHFDNSADNPANPDPTQTVTMGQQTWNEMFECQYMSVDAGPDIACKALVAASLSRHLDDQPRALFADQIRQLIAWGAERTPERIAAAEAKYIELKSRQPSNSRIDVAFALVLNNQRQFAKARQLAAACLRLNPADLEAQRARIWAELALGKNDDALAHLRDLAGELERVTPAKKDDELLTASRFLGAAVACASRLPAVEVDALKLDSLRAEMVQRLGAKFAASFADGERAMLERLAGKNPATIEECLTSLSIDEAFGYEAESRRLLGSLVK
jgi:peroxiredoxin/mono/diheme cytochrome c family protein